MAEVGSRREGFVAVDDFVEVPVVELGSKTTIATKSWKRSPERLMDAFDGRMLWKRGDREAQRRRAISAAAEVLWL